MPAFRKAFQFNPLPRYPWLDAIGSAGGATMSGQRVSEIGSLRVAAIWIATTILADEIASLPIKIVRRDDETRTPLQPEALKALWSKDPNDMQTQFELVSAETLSLMLWGVTYTALGWTTKSSLEARWPLDPDGATLRREGGSLILTVPGHGELFNRPGRLPQFQYTPLYTMPGDPLTPISPVRKAAELAGLSMAYDETVARLIAKGLNPSAIVTVGENVPEDVAEDLSKRLERIHGGASNAGKVAILGGKDLKLERLSMSLADAQFVAQSDRVFQMLLAIWRVPPTVAGMVDKPSTWGTGVAEFSRGLERFTLRPITKRREASAEKYITRHVDESLQVRHKFDSMLSASPKERADIQRTRLLAGLTSTERILAQEDEAPFSEDETVYSQLSMATTRERELKMAREHAQTVAAQAEAVAKLIAAGVDENRAWSILGLDPAKLEPVAE